MHKPVSRDLGAAQAGFFVGVGWLAAFLPMLDTSIVNLALPQLANAFKLAPNELGWVTNAYLLPLVVTIPAVGRVGDAINRAHVLVAGAVVFAGASLWAALVSSWEMLVLMRAFQGIGAAALVTMSMAIVSAAFPPGSDRDRALSWYLSGPAFGGALGPVAGAALTAAGGWRLMFVGQVPLALIVAIGGLWLSSPPSGARRSLDIPGLLLSGIMLLGLSVALLEAPIWGWSSPPILAAWITATGAAVAFVVHERRTPQPLIPPQVFHSRFFRASGIAGAAVWFGVISGFMLLPLYLQVARGFDSLHASLLLGAWPLGALLMYPFAGSTVARGGPSLTMKWALIVTLAAAAIMGFYGAATPDFVIVLVGLALGVATAIGQVSTAVGAVSEFANKDAGIASGVFNTLRQVGSILGGALPASMLVVGADGSGITYEGLQAAFVSRTLVLAISLTAVHVLLRPHKAERRHGRG
jgi:MFS family permease